MVLVKAFLLLVLGFFMLIKGADYFVDGASGIAARFGIPPLVIGLTIVAMGTSAPEAAVSINAAIHGNAGITVGNVVGSNIMNVLLILGITSVIIAVPVKKSTVRYEIPFMCFITVLFGILGYFGGVINLVDGLILWFCFLCYFAYLIYMAKHGEIDEDADIVERSLLIQIICLIGGAVCIVLGSDLTVDNATVIAQALGMDARLIGLTIIAFGTSLPELVTSVTAARKGQPDIAIGNIVGSNIFNILFVCGTTALITSVDFAPSFVIDTAIALVAALLLWFGVFRHYALGRKMGFLMLLTYAAYFVFLLV